MNEKALNKDSFIKYLKFLIDFSNRLLTKDDVEIEFENIMREYALFLYRVVSSDKIDKKVKDEFVGYDLFDKGDLEDKSNSVSEGFLHHIPIFNKLIPAANKQIKKEKIQKLNECLSLTLFKVEGYEFS